MRFFTALSFLSLAALASSAPVANPSSLNELMSLRSKAMLTSKYRMASLAMLSRRSMLSFRSIRRISLVSPCQIFGDNRQSRTDQRRRWDWDRGFQWCNRSGRRYTNDGRHRASEWEDQEQSLEITDWCIKTPDRASSGKICTWHRASATDYQA